MSSGDLSKLPKWARDEILRLRMRLAEAREREMGEDKVTRIAHGTHPDFPVVMGPRAYIPETDAVSFSFDEGARYRSNLSVDARLLNTKGYGSDVKRWLLELNAPGGTIRVLPRVSNVIWVEVFHD